MIDGLLDKLRITSYEHPKTFQLKPPILTYEAMFNPETFSIENQINYCSEEGPGTTSSPAKFRNIPPPSFSIELLIDGTGASGEKREVLADIELFKATVGYYGKVHRPNFLVVTWGTFIAPCVLKSYSVNYKLFRSNGTPLRATISASFQEFRPKILESLINNKSSPDVTHHHTIMAGDQLFMISQDTYNTPEYHVQLADFNQLDTIRRIQPGQQLIMPPLKESENEL